MPVCEVCGDRPVSRADSRTCGPECRQERERRRAKATYHEIRQVVATRICIICDMPFAPAGQGRRVTCSKECRVLFQQGACGSRVLDRAKRHGVEIETINRIRIFRRDRWTCQYCGRPSPHELMGSDDPRAPELDHITPMALGGGHTGRNVHLACRTCNRRKGQSRKFHLVRAHHGSYTIRGRGGPNL
ncbi:HNH endonuclease [Geminicoccus flavidas]|uniref:HNH endonuclease n=1 Tax=Geminicoccus flavidas TaxID=2506407 RepID=UPI002AB12766|nr:HNH endonuclease [Geminicoccus flavidas]